MNTRISDKAKNAPKNADRKKKRTIKGKPKKRKTNATNRI